jgi:hypothetical protein
MLVVVIGRGHSGTRLASWTLSQSGVYMGPMNNSGDLVPAKKMYEAVSLAGNFVDYIGNSQWDFSPLINSEVPKEFTKLVREYLDPVLNSHHPKKGWKLPETVLALPWIYKMFPEAYYIHWVRDPRGSTSGPHITDDLSKFNIKGSIMRPKFQIPSLSKKHIVWESIPHLKMTAKINERLESWIYQEEIVRATPKPKNFLKIKYEDFVLEQNITMNILSNFLKMDLNKVQVLTENLKETAFCPNEVLKKYGYIKQL